LKARYNITMTLEAEKEKVKARFILKVDNDYSPISRFEHIPHQDQQELLSGEASFYNIQVEASYHDETYYFISQGMIMSHDDHEREEEFEAFVMSEGGLFEEVINKVKTWHVRKDNAPDWSRS